MIEPDSLSDEAMGRVLFGYSAHKRSIGATHAFKDGWREAARRALALIEERERRAFERGYNTVAIVSAEEAYLAFRAEEGKK